MSFLTKMLLPVRTHSHVRCKKIDFFDFVNYAFIGAGAYMSSGSNLHFRQSTPCDGDGDGRGVTTSSQGRVVLCSLVESEQIGQVAVPARVTCLDRQERMCLVSPVGRASPPMMQGFRF
jgi:hypothetical protein